MQGVPYVTLSYHEDIREMLSAVIPQVPAAALKEVLLQYLHVVEAI